MNSIIEVALGVIFDEHGHILIAQRQQEQHQGGLWEFPGGKLEKNEDAKTALIRELNEEVNIEPLKTVPLIKVHFDYADCTVILHVYRVAAFTGKAYGKEGQLIRWVDCVDLSKYQFPAANKTILSAITLGYQYAIIDGPNSEQLLLALASLASKGVSLIQIRMKQLSAQEIVAMLPAIRAKYTALGVKVLFNSEMQVNLEQDEGLHLSAQMLMDLDERPDIKGLIAASCHNLSELYQAEKLALDFAVLSPVYQTRSHPDAHAMGWKFFKKWVDKVNIPVFAMGGMNLDTEQLAREYGAQGIAGITCFKNNELTLKVINV